MEPFELFGRAVATLLCFAATGGVLLTADLDGWGVDAVQQAVVVWWLAFAGLAPWLSLVLR